MHKRTIPPFIVYFFSLLTILGWWYLSFSTSPGYDHAASRKRTTAPARKPDLPAYFQYLSIMDRDKLREALGGDPELIAQLISAWDADAQILESQGQKGVLRLSRAEYARAHLISRQIRQHSRDELDALEALEIKDKIVDDNGVSFSLNPSPTRFLPQTYIAASFLLSLTEAENIVAIPQGMRGEKQLYPETLTAKIPLDIDRYNSEEIYQKKPDIAFVAYYSHPSTIQALKNQGIPVFTIDSINTLPEIMGSIERLGHVIHRPLEAELLTLFMNAAMYAMDNRLMAFHQLLAHESSAPRVLFLNHHTRYSMPTTKTISGQMLDRLGMHKFSFLPAFHERKEEWAIPLEQEQIVRFDPECLIIATSNPDALLNTVSETPAFKKVTAIKNGAVYCLDDAPQAPTQYVILAYFDIANALTEFMRSQ